MRSKWWLIIVPVLVLVLAFAFAFTTTPNKKEIKEAAADASSFFVEYSKKVPKKMHEFLESNLDGKVLNFTFTSLTKPGDNFNGLIRALEVKLSKNSNHSDEVMSHNFDYDYADANFVNSINIIILFCIILFRLKRCS